MTPSPYHPIVIPNPPHFGGVRNLLLSSLVIPSEARNLLFPAST
jgi:hypothetical protein